MNARFARLEDRLNGAVNARLSNRRVSVGVLTFDAIFEDAGALGLDGLVQTNEPRLSAVPSAIGDQLARDAVLTLVHPVTLHARALRLARAEPDGSGFYTLYLREV